MQDIPGLLDNSVRDLVDDFGATRVTLNGPADGWTPARLLERQQGVFRVNCRGVFLNF